MTLTEIQQALTTLDARPRQSLGQNFLYDQNLARWIADQLDIQGAEHIVEIGPGLGSLTERLADRAGHLTLIEKDRAMVQWLSGKFSQSNVELFHEDALEFDLRKLYGRGPVKVAGNLPYYISTPLIAKYTSALSPASMLVLLLQHEVAARLCAKPGSEDFGAMSVCAARRWDIRYAKKIPPTVFYPQPQVSSALVVFTRKPASKVPPCDEALLESLIRRGFSERRKQLRNMLPEYKDRWPEICAKLGVQETLRAEELSLAQWEEFVRFVSPLSAQCGEEMFDVVNERDEVLEAKPRDVVHVNNLRHRASHMLIFNQAGELFLQKRSIWKDRNPAVWDSSAAGHVDAGETYLEAAVREVREEIGVDCELEKIGKLPCVEENGWEFIEVFRGKHEGPFKLAPLEVETGAFFPLPQVKEWLARSPEEFSPVFAQVMRFI